MKLLNDRSQQGIGVLGAGHMGRALIAGLLQAGYSKKKVWATVRNPDHLQQLAAEHSIRVTLDNCELCRKSSVVIIAVRQSDLEEVLVEIAETLYSCRPVIVSIVAGISIEQIAHWLGKEYPIVRAIPNIPVHYRVGATGLYSNEYVDEEEQVLVESIFQALGVAHWVKDQKLIDVICAVASSGPAYYYYFAEAMSNAAISLGLTQNEAELFVSQTMLGASRMMINSQDSAAQLCAQVAVEGGTTRAALQILQNNHVDESIRLAIRAAYGRASELSSVLDSIAKE